jgi:hypothetical protein
MGQASKFYKHEMEYTEITLSFKLFFQNGKLTHLYSKLSVYTYFPSKLRMSLCLTHVINQIIINLDIYLIERGI